VSCDGDGAVLRLDLSRNGLAGVLPSSLASLSRLVNLELLENALQGSLPACLGSLNHLQLLNVYANQLSGTLGSWLGNLSSLIYLVLDANLFEGSIPAELGSLTALAKLDLDTNHLAGSLPLSLASLSSLTYLNLGGQLGGAAGGLSGTLDALASLPALATLRADLNRFTGSLPELATVSLVNLALGSNQLSGGLPASLAQQVGLTFLDLASNRLAGPIPPALAQLTSLRTASLRESGLCGPSPWGTPIEGALPDCVAVSAAAPSPSRSLLAGLLAGGAALAAAGWAARRLRARRRKQQLAFVLEEQLLPSEAADGDEGAGEEELEQLATPPSWRASAAEVTLLRRIGAGGFGVVFAGRWAGSSVAVKAMRLACEPPDSFPLAAPCTPWLTASSSFGATFGAGSELRDIPFLSLLAQLRHPHLCAIYAFVARPPLLVMELCLAGSLAEHLQRCSLASLPWARRADILAKVASGVEFLHRQTPPIIHMDLKVANILLDAGMQPKVSDFGLAAFAVAGRLHLRGTPAYLAPEVALGQQVQRMEALDSYGFGWVAHATAHLGVFPSCEPDYAHLAPREVLARRAAAGFAAPVDAGVPLPLAGLIRACLAVDPGARPSLGELRAELEAMALPLLDES
jgi:hypothetical protein